MIDIDPDIGMMLIMGYSYSTISVPTERQQLCFAMCGVWALRLVCFVFYRIVVRGHDWR